jgi:predicted deacylase
MTLIESVIGGVIIVGFILVVAIIETRRARKRRRNGYRGSPSSPDGGAPDSVSIASMSELQSGGSGRWDSGGNSG